MQDPIDLISDTLASTDDSSDSDDSRAAVAVEPIDQAAAEVSSLTGLSVVQDFCSMTRMRRWSL